METLIQPPALLVSRAHEKLWRFRPRYSLRTFLFLSLSAASGLGLRLRWEPWIQVHTQAATDPVMSVHLSPDGQRWVTSKDVSRVPEITPEYVEQLQKLNAEDRNRMLASLSSNDVQVSLWSANAAKPIREMIFPSTFIYFSSSDSHGYFSHNGNWFVLKPSAKPDRPCQIWSTVTGETFSFPSIYPDAYVAFAHGKPWCVLQSMDNEAIVWNLEEKKTLATLTAGKGKFCGFRFLEKDWLLVAQVELPGEMYSRDRIIEVPYRRQLFETKIHEHVLFSSDGAQLFLGNSREQKTTVLEWPSKRKLGEFKGWICHEGCLSPKGHTAIVWNQEWSKYGVYFGGAWLRDLDGNEDMVKLEEAEDGHYFWGLSGNRVYAQTWRELFLGSEAGKFLAWDTATGKKLYDLPGIAFLSPDDRVLVWPMGKAIHILDTQSGKELYRLEGNAEPVTEVTFSPDGQRLLCASQDGSVRIWERRRPEAWWGVAWLPELWLALVFTVALAWSIRRDTRRFNPRPA